MEQQFTVVWIIIIVIMLVCPLALEPAVTCHLMPDTGATKIVVCAVHCYQCECCGEYVM